MNKEMIRVIVKNENGQVYIEGYQGQNLLEVLQKNNVYVSDICHGNGTCGKCKIKVLSGNLPITGADQRILSKEELSRGIRLACKVFLQADYKETKEESLSIEVLGKAEGEIAVEGVNIKERKPEDHTTEYLEEKKVNKNYFIAIDIGTTTLAMALVNAETGKVCDAYTSLNHQRKFGADVISRIVAANEGKAEELRQLIEEDLWMGICRLLQTENKFFINTCIKDEDREQSETIICGIIISGNTTMIHLLMEYPCQSLGKYPFGSEYLGKIECTLKECIKLKSGGSALDECSMPNTDSIYKIYEKIPVTILPGISAFVGGDIVADILTCPGFETDAICLLIDLGTNGEMVLGNKDRLLATSTAAGPAFEGGNIICGTASIPGSICRVKIQNQKAVTKTIKDEMPPTGICGTGLVSVIAQLKQNKLMDKQGRLRYPYDKKGYPLWVHENGEKIALYQQDVREFQMAKSAIRAGIEILMEEYGCKAKDISHVYLAGGFGVNLSEEDAVSTGILPGEFRGKTESIGNGALQGAVRFGIEKMKNAESSDLAGIRVQKINERIEDIVRKTQNISLAENTKFRKAYLEYLEF